MSDPVIDFTSKAAFEASIKKNIVDAGMLQTPPDKAVFWSNDYRDNKPFNKALAEKMAEAKGAFVIKMKAPIIDEMGTQEFIKAHPELDKEPEIKATKSKVAGMMSEDFAKRAKGEVAIYANYTGAGSYCRTVECEALMKNDKVTHVRFLNPEDLKGLTVSDLDKPEVMKKLMEKEKVLPKEEWYKQQRQQWVAGRIEMLNETNKVWPQQNEKYIKEHSAWEKTDKKAKEPSKPNSWAIGDFANEVANAYHNMELKDKPSYIKQEIEVGYIKQLHAALDKISPELRKSVNEELEKKLTPEELKSFNAHQAAQESKTTGSLSMPTQDMGIKEHKLTPVLTVTNKQPGTNSTTL